MKSQNNVKVLFIITIYSWSDRLILLTVEKDRNFFKMTYIHFVPDCDCPDCAPYCSTSGFCQQTQAGGSRPCDGKECYTDDDCYLAPEVLAKLLGSHGCFFFEPQCDTDTHSCSYWDSDLFRPYSNCRLKDGVFGDACSTEVTKCKSGGMFPTGSGLIPLKEVTTTTGSSIQVLEKRNLAAGQCEVGSCRTRAGSCCKPVWRSLRKVCPFYC